MLDILADSLIDSVRILPFLYLSYLVVEYAEHRMSERTKEMIHRAGKAGPVLGALIGLIPQCGFAAAAAGLFAGGMISPGTLLAVFLSTSDEMLPIMVSEGMSVSVILRILIVKAVAAAAAGLIFDLAVSRMPWRRREISEHADTHGHEHCGCESHGIWYPALNHTARTAVFLFLISLAIGAAMEAFDVDGLSRQISQYFGMEELAAGLIGMIPNCAASVLITQLYLEGILGSGALFSGLLCTAGTGLLVLYRENRDRRMNLVITLVLYVSGAAAGIFAGALGIL